MQTHFRITVIPRHALTCAVPLLLAIFPLSIAIVGCGRAGGAADTSVAADPMVADARTVPQSSGETSEPSLPEPAEGDVVARLETLRAQGRFEEFIDGALNAAGEQTGNPALELQASEALLAAGRAHEAEQTALHAAALAADTLAPDMAIHALKLWAIARLRQSKPLGDSRFAELLAQLPPADHNVQLLAFWRDALGPRTAYRTSTSMSAAVELPMADAPAGSLPFELAAIQARANGASMPLVFVDTGAQHTVMTVAAARSAGVTIGFAGTSLMGFKGLTAGPAVIETLELGSLVLYDVPVLVGDSVPLVAVGGQISLGTELMHHVRFSIDYPARRVTAQPTGAPSSAPAAPSICDIPLWTFSQICLARGQLPSGAMARALVDTGDRAGTFVSYRWARRNIPQLRGSGAPVLFRLKKRNMALESLELGSLALSTWPVQDTIPSELDRLNLVDVILGHDLLWPYQLTIDLPARMLHLHTGTNPRADREKNEN